MTAKSVGLRFNATPQMAEHLAALAEQDDVSVAHVIRRALREFLAKNPQPQGAPR